MVDLDRVINILTTIPYACCIAIITLYVHMRSLLLKIAHAHTHPGATYTYNVHVHVRTFYSPYANGKVISYVTSLEVSCACS